MGAIRTYQNSGLGEMRMWPVPKFSKYLIFYRVFGSDLEILRVLHGAQDLQAIFAPPDEP
jgi:toxin ParE1/3/4